MKKIILQLLFSLTFIISFAQSSFNYLSMVKEIKNENGTISIHFKDNRVGTQCIGYANPFEYAVHYNLNPIKNWFLQYPNTFSINPIGESYITTNIYNNLVPFLYMSDTTILKDTSILGNFCDTSNICNFVDRIFPIDYILDQNGNYHFVAYSGMQDINFTSTYNAKYKLIYFTMNGNDSSTINSSENTHYHFPDISQKITNYRVIENLNPANVFPNDIPCFSKLIRLANNRTLLINGKDLNNEITDKAFQILKIDDQNIITSDSTAYFHGLRVGFHAYSTSVESKETENNLILLIKEIAYDSIGNDQLTSSIWKFNTEGSLVEQTYYNDYNEAKLHFDGFIFNGTDLYQFASNGIQVDTIHFEKYFKHAIIKTKNNNHINLDVQFGGIYPKLLITLLDTNGHIIKVADLDILLQYPYNGSFPVVNQIFTAIDSFENIYMYTNFQNVGSSHCLNYNASGGVFNLHAIYQVSGNIVNDINTNCILDAPETGVKNTLVELQLNGKHYYTLSDEMGHYKFMPYDTGSGKVILHLENQSTFINACQDTFAIYLSESLANPEINFLLHSNFCNHPTPKVNVDISTPILLRCSDNLYTLNVSNLSNDTAFNAYVVIEFDDDLAGVDTAFLSAQNLGNNTYRFNIGDLNPMQSILKKLIVHVNCDSTILGETHCVKATAFPYEMCTTTSTKYMQAEAVCKNDSVIFILNNTGTAEIFQQAYRIIEDDTLTNIGTLYFSLSQISQRLSFYNPNGKTFRLETRQYPIYPNEDTILSVAIEGCGNANFSTGFINQFAQDDDAPNVSIDCHENVGSFDPNEKSAFPVGYENTHLVEKNQALEYTIHFQNTGSYPAMYVKVLDTLSENLDIKSLQILGASHPYTVALLDSNILEFTFLYINLIQASADSVLSNGFIKFSIKPKTSTTIGSEIKNNAYITFDLNTAIQTNTVQHQIGTNFIKTSIVSTTKNTLFNPVNISLYPNPASDLFTLAFTNVIPHHAQLLVYSLEGKVIYQQQLLEQKNSIPIAGWSKGFYSLEVRNEQNNLIQSFKLIIQ